MHLSLPPEGSPEYWRAVRQLVMRAKVDVDRLWGRQEQYASQGVLEFLGGMSSGRVDEPPVIIDYASASTNDRYNSYSVVVPVVPDAACWPLGVPSGASFRYQLGGDYLAPSGVIAVPSGAVYRTGSLSLTVTNGSPLPPYLGVCRQSKSARQGLSTPLGTLALHSLVWFTGTGELSIRLYLSGVANREGRYTLCEFNCSDFVGVTIDRHPDSHPDAPESITLLGY